MAKKIIIFIALATVFFFLARFFLAQNGKKYSPPDLSGYNTTPLPEVLPSGVLPDKSLPDNIVLSVPFQPQAPFAEWSDPRQENGCEEASMLMAAYAVQKKSLSANEALDQIRALADYEERIVGTFYDTSPEDTAKIYNTYFQSAGHAQVRDNINADDIKQELAHGHIVLVPTNGRLLDNPFYKQPGPTRHMLVLRGYDNEKGIFITNDPGTKRGEGYEYPYQTVMDADLNYPTGQEANVVNDIKVMIVISND